MASRVIWSSQAREDVEAIAEFIARDSEAYAGTVVQKLLAVGRMLQRFPFAGRMVPDRGEPTVREVFVYSYRVIYRVRSEAVTVLTVIHGRKMLSVEEIPEGDE